MPPLRRFKILNKADVLQSQSLSQSIESLCLTKPKPKWHRDATHMKKAKKKTKQAMKAMKATQAKRKTKR